MAIDDKKWAEIQAKWKAASETKPVKAEFKKDLARGHDGERSFYEKYQGSVTHLDGRNADFEINKTAETIELKTDYYDYEKTANFFMERYSYAEEPGGVWQAAKKGITYFIYHFDSHDVTFIFNTKQLVRRLEKLEPTLKLVQVQNKNYITRGYKVPIVLLSEMCLEPADINLHEPKRKKK